MNVGGFQDLLLFLAKTHETMPAFFRNGGVFSRHGRAGAADSGLLALALASKEWSEKSSFLDVFVCSCFYRLYQAQIIWNDDIPFLKAT